MHGNMNIKLAICGCRIVILQT